MTAQTLSILSAMLDDPYAEWYGLELANRTNLKGGTVYPALARLEHAGWLASSWEEIDPSLEHRPRRRLYRLTGEGALCAGRAVDEHLERLGVRKPVRRPVGARKGAVA
jgi:DNA-binding PadR family transcriptional regulator